TNTTNIATNTTNITNLTDSVGDLKDDSLLWNKALLYTSRCVCVKGYNLELLQCHQL
ncbi:autotransport adhesin, partial [Escherichia coli]